jgi:hypothetical protein
MAFLDNIPINRDNLKEHKEHIRAVMTAHKEAGLYQKAEKCGFDKEEVKYLGLNVAVNGIRMDPGKLQAIANLKALEKLKEVQAFLGFPNIY